MTVFEQKPQYTTAFLFVKDGYEIPEVPAWAIKLVLLHEEIGETFILEWFFERDETLAWRMILL
jgi:hypothetical protein